MTEPLNPYQTPAERVEDVWQETGIGNLPPPAERGTRLIAALLDGLCYAVGIILLMFIEGLPPDPNNTVWLLKVYAGAAPVMIVNLIFLARDGQSLGKKALGIRIVESDGARASLTRIFLLRMVAPTLVGFIPIVGPFFGLADSLLIFRADRRCLHDHMAGTIVVMAS